VLSEFVSAVVGVSVVSPPSHWVGAEVVCLCGGCAIVIDATVDNVPGWGVVVMSAVPRSGGPLWVISCHRPKITGILSHAGVVHPNRYGQIRTLFGTKKHSKIPVQI